jgi:hypothetical protein
MRIQLFTPMWIRIQHYIFFYTNPDPTFQFDANPDPTFRIDAYPDKTFQFDTDPDPRRSEANLPSLTYGPSTAPFLPPSLHL